jgi:hypothetical protein
METPQRTDRHSIDDCPQERKRRTDASGACAHRVGKANPSGTPVLKCAKLLALGILSSAALTAQQIHVTADLLSPQTTAAMFGNLPKTYHAANVVVCNRSNAALTVPLAFAAQQTRLSGVVMLPQDAAISVIASAQGSSKLSKLLRGGVTLVQLAAIAAGWSTLSSTFKALLTSASLSGSSAISVLSLTIPTHTYLVFQHEELADPLQLAPLGCAAGTVIVESATSNAKVDATIALAGGAAPPSGQ